MRRGGEGRGRPSGNSTARRSKPAWRSKRSKDSKRSTNEPVHTGCIRRKVRMGNIASKRRGLKCSRHDGQNASTTKKPSQRIYTNKSGHAKSSWTGEKKAGLAP